MKIAINKCYGGFGISEEALIRLIEIGSKAVECTPADTLSTKYTVHVRDGFYTDGFTQGVVKNGNYYSLSWDDKVRTDPDLIAVLEDMGKDAWGSYAKIAIVTVPDDVAIEIDDYDGVETVREKSRSWG